MVSLIENPIARGIASPFTRFYACIIASAIARVNACIIASSIARVNACIIASAIARGIACIIASTIASNIDKVEVNGSARSTRPAGPLKLTAQNCSGVLLCQFTF